MRCQGSIGYQLVWHFSPTPYTNCKEALNCFCCVLSRHTALVSTAALICSDQSHGKNCRKSLFPLWHLDKGYIKFPWCSDNTPAFPRGRLSYSVETHPPWLVAHSDWPGFYIQEAACLTVVCGTMAVYMGALNWGMHLGGCL